jgi:hypothetical protein
MNCQDIRRFLGPFLDDELDTRTSYELGLHLNDCAPCRGRVEVERRLEANIASAVRRDDTTPEMWERALAGVTPPKQRRWWPWALARPAFWAAALLLAGLATLWWAPGRPDLVRVAFEDHRELLAGRFGPDVATTDAEAAAGYVCEKTSLAATLPGAADGRSVVGARLCFFRGSPVGLVIYKVRGEMASLFLISDVELGRFRGAKEGSETDTGMIAITRSVPGGAFSVVAVGPAAAREQVERLAMEVASR